jgi:nucleoprotein TPR
VVQLTVIVPLRCVVPASAAGSGAVSDEKQLSDLNEIVRYLRREKEAVELNLERVTQQMVTYRQQSEHRAKALEEIKLQLQHEQAKGLCWPLQRAVAASLTAVVLLCCAAASGSSEQSSAQLKQLQNQLSIVQESNSTLRDENSRNLARAKDWQTKAEALSAQIAPLNQNIRALQATIDSLQTEKYRLLFPFSRSRFSVAEPRCFGV